MVRAFKIAITILAIFCLCSVAVFAQSADDDSASLGDLARYLREHKDTDPEPVPLIDNDNFSQVLAEGRKQGPAGILTFSIDSGGNGFKVSAPDVTCSLAFNANSAALISNPFALRNLPAEELAKLDGPARIEGDDLEIAVHNGSDWTVREITIGLTIVHKPTSETEAVNAGTAKFLPAVASDDSSPDDEKMADTTLLFHVKGNAPPLSTTVFRQALTSPLPPDEDWHWAIVDAQASPPAPVLNGPSGLQPAPGNADLPAPPAGLNPGADPFTQPAQPPASNALPPQPQQSTPASAPAAPSSQPQAAGQASQPNQP